MTLRAKTFWLFGLASTLSVAVLYGLSIITLPALLGILAASVVVGGALGWLLDQGMLARLARFSAEAARIGADGRFDGRLTVSGVDEVSQLGQALNGALDRLEHSRALLQATFESTDAGFVTVDTAGRPISTNRQFIELWSLSDQVLAAAGEAGFQLLADQTTRPDHALERFRYWQSHPSESGRDEFELQSGRTLECFTRPQRLDNAEAKIVGRTWDCRDITARKAAEATVNRQMGELISVRDIAFAGSEVNNEEELAELATKIIGANLYPADVFNIGLVNMATGALEVLSSHYVRGDIAGVVLPPGHGITGRAVTTGQTQIVPDITRDPAYVEINSDTRSEICVPMKAGRRSIGFLNVESAHLAAFGEADERLLTILAGQLATALEKVRMSAEVQRLAITDALTGLYNRRYFFTTAQRELERARRHNRPLSVIMLDLDHFKRVNDTYGHAAGDLMLKSIADYCRKDLREADLMGRYGGEEFVVLLPETTQASAQEVAERLRLGIAALEVPLAQDIITITASLGLATLDGSQPALDKLLDCADQALYQAKAAGRNRYCVWSGTPALKTQAPV